MDSIWLYHPEKYSGIENESRKYILHPKIRQIIEEATPNSLLDYGCGDSSLIHGLNDKINISIYDISSKILNLAKQNLQEKDINIYYDVNKIPENNFEIVILSLVLMTIPNKETIIKELSKIYSLLKNDGQILIGVTHPCFRQYNFSSFHTSYLDDENFNYINEGKKFKVTLRDPVSNKNTSFHDFHWTFSTTLNLLIKSGFEITEVYELPDVSFEQSYFNKDIPPYLLIVGKKKNTL